MHDTTKDDDEDNVDLDSGYQEPQEILSSRILSNSNNSPVTAQTHYNPHNGQYTTESRTAGGSRRKHRTHHQSNNNFHGSRPVVSSPTRIENPNVLPALNLYPGHQSQNQSPATTMGRYQATTATIGGRGKSKYVTTVGTNDRNNGGSSMTASLNRRINEFTASRNCANI